MDPLDHHHRLHIHGTRTFSPGSPPHTHQLPPGSAAADCRTPDYPENKPCMGLAGESQRAGTKAENQRPCGAPVGGKWLTTV